MRSLYQRQWIQAGKHKRAYRKFLRGDPVWARLDWFRDGDLERLATSQLGEALRGFVFLPPLWGHVAPRKPSVSQRRRGSRYP